MKKLLIALVAGAVLFSFSACSKEEIPSVEERAQALLTGEITIDEMEEKGWVDESLINYLDNNSDDFKNAVSGSNNANSESTETNSYLGEFDTVDLQGNEVKSDIFSQYDLTLVNLWTTNCGYCIDEMPYLEEIKNELTEDGKSFNVVGICLDINASGEVNDEKLEKALDIIDSTGVTYTNIMPDDVIWNNKASSVSAVPESFFVDKNGELVGKTMLGAKDKENWLSTIESKFDELGGN